MSRLLKQVYSENIYIEFRFESSLRKYDKKPTKKIKCEAYCRHCINHHRRSDVSPSCDSRAGLGSRSKIKRFAENSGERPQEKSVISEAKTIRLSKQKQPSPKRKELNLLEMNMYRDLLQRKKKEGVEENSSSMEDQIFFNEFGQGQEVEEELNKDSVDKDFDGIEIKRKNVENSEGKRQEDVVQTTSEKQINEKIDVEQEMEQLIQEQQSEHVDEIGEPEVLQLAECLEKEEEEVLEQEKIIEQLVSEPTEPNNTLSFQQPQISQHQQIIQQAPEACQPNQTQDIPLPTSQPLQIEKSKPQEIDQRQMGESMMDKCLVFQGGRIYVDTSGQNFYISVRVFNKLRRKYSDIEQLTTILIQQRPCLISKQSQIRHQLQQYLHTFQ